MAKSAKNKQHNLKLNKMEKNVKFQTSKADKVFTLARDNEGNIRIVLGDKVISQKKFDTFEQADKYIGHKPYEIIFNSVLVLIEYHKNLEGQKPEENTKNERTDN